MKNKRFEAFCQQTDPLSSAMAVATGAERDIIEDWFTWACKSNKSLSEQDYLNIIDEELPGLAERCARLADLEHLTV